MGMVYKTLRSRIGTSEVFTEMHEHGGMLVCAAHFSRVWWPFAGPSRRLKTVDIRLDAYEDPLVFQQRVHDDAVELAYFVRDR